VVQPSVKDAASDFLEALQARRQQLQSALTALCRCRRTRAAMSRDELLNVDGLLLTTARGGAGVGAGDGGGGGDDDGGSVWTDGAYVWRSPVALRGPALLPCCPLLLLLLLLPLLLLLLLLQGVLGWHDPPAPSCIDSPPPPMHL
jgi:hypothetical protein